MITFSQYQTDNNNRMITIAKFTSILSHYPSDNIFSDRIMRLAL